MVTMSVRAKRVSATREQILVAAERLFAEHGLTVSNRQISEAAGQGNNFAVGYHFGAKTDLVRAILHRHQEQIELVRLRMIADVGDSTDLRVWASCLVRPYTEHLAALGSPSWFARFGAQVATDPMLRAIMIDEALVRPSLLRVIEGLHACLPALPEEVRRERSDMARMLIEHVCAERERALAEGTGTPRATWDDTATGLIDALVGLWLAPVTNPPVTNA